MTMPSVTTEPCAARRQRLHVALFFSCALGLLFSSAGGCTRTYYRQQADREVTHILDQKNMPGRWGLPNFRLEYDPRSRYFDPTNPDHPPMPPDDPNSHVFMHVVDGMKGARNYHVDGDLKAVQSPYWRQQLATYADVDDDGTVNLTLNGAVRMAIVNEPDYRQQLEELYFSALDVSTERFRFDTQFFGGINPLLYTQQAKNAPSAGGLSRSTLGINDNLRFQRQFAAGGQLFVGFINTIVWQFAGPDTNSNTTILNFSLIQPLLRAGGRRFILEQLTIVERGMLANLRAFERYRQGFYTNLAVGDGGTTGAQRRGGFFGGTGLTGFTGQGSTGFGGVGDATGFGRGGTGNAVGGGTVGSGFAGGGAGTIGGYIGLLQQTQQIRNSRQNLNAQLRTLKLLLANLEAGTIDIAQVDQFRQNIETAKATLLQSEITRDNATETYVRTLIGLPPDLPMALDDELIRQFQFIDPKTNALYERVEDFVDELGNLPLTPDLDILTMALDRLEAFRKETAVNLNLIRDDLKRWEAGRDARRQTMTAEESAIFDADLVKSKATFADLEAAFGLNAAEAVKLRATLAPATRKQTTDSLVVTAKGLASLIQESSLVQVRSRLESVTLNPIALDPQLGLQIARANRLDWMNNRAALVDSWRLIAYNARSLLSTLNITIDGNLSTRGDNPVKFQSSTGTLRAGLQFDAPFTRLVERNNYRSALIEYQRDRRTYIQYEDTVNQSLRQTLRTLKQLEVNLEIQRRAVVIAARRVDQTREVLSKPPDPVQPGTAAAGLGPTAALNLLTALNDLQGSQNNFMSVWLNHYASRMILVRELGLMQLDDNNLWIDRPLDELLANAEMCPPEELPPDVPQQWYEALDRLPPTGEEVPSDAAGGTANELPAPRRRDFDVDPDAGGDLMPAIPKPPVLPPPQQQQQLPRLNSPSGEPATPPARGARRTTHEPKTADVAPAGPLRTASKTRIVSEEELAPPSEGTVERVVEPPAPLKPARSGQALFGSPPPP
ncbi:MAG: TolC family protein [Planctomycetia bacterium]|nr:TolC family protein [Planctomycetia bacterium]